MQMNLRKKIYKKRFREKNDGYVILTAVLIMLVITTSVSIGMLLISTSFVNSSGVTIQGIRAQQAADTCAEEALHKLRTDYNYPSGESINLNVGGAHCNIVEILGTGALDRTIIVEGFAGNSISRVKVSVDSLNPIVVSKWDYTAN